MKNIKPTEMEKEIAERAFNALKTATYIVQSEKYRPQERVYFGAGAAFYGLVASKLTNNRDYWIIGQGYRSLAVSLSYFLPPLRIHLPMRISAPDNWQFATEKEALQKWEDLVRTLAVNASHAAKTLNNDKIKIGTRIVACGTLAATAKCIYWLTGDKRWEKVCRAAQEAAFYLSNAFMGRGESKE